MGIRSGGVHYDAASSAVGYFLYRCKNLIFTQLIECFQINFGLFCVLSDPREIW